MLVLTGQGGTGRLHKESHQIMDVVEMFTPATKWATTIANANTIPEIVRKAVRVAMTEKPGATRIRPSRSFCFLGKGNGGGHARAALA